MQPVRPGTKAAAPSSPGSMTTRTFICALWPWPSLRAGIRFPGAGVLQVYSSPCHDPDWHICISRCLRIQETTPPPSFSSHPLPGPGALLLFITSLRSHLSAPLPEQQVPPAHHCPNEPSKPCACVCAVLRNHPGPALASTFRRCKAGPEFRHPLKYLM